MRKNTPVAANLVQSTWEDINRTFIIKLAFNVQLCENRKFLKEQATRRRQECLKFILYSPIGNLTLDVMT